MELNTLDARMNEKFPYDDSTKSGEILTAHLEQMSLKERFSVFSFQFSVFGLPLKKYKGVGIIGHGILAAFG
jgi:hypothetical protein